MYEAYFGLRRRPFSSVAQVKEYFPATSIESARQNLIRCVQRGEGAGLAIGPSGTGKTLLCQLVAEHFQGQFRAAVLTQSSVTTRRALLQAILYALGQPYRGMDEGELRLALVEYLNAKEQCPYGMLLAVDDAHLLPLRVLDEIRSITNVTADGLPRVRLVLAGCGPLEERLASPKLDSFSQRIVARCYLESLSRAETQEYIRALLCHAGGQADQVFSAEAAQAVHRATDGVPRLVNQVCDHALILAFTARRRPVDVACVEEAWADLQQLPTPWSGETQNPAQTTASVVEFGGLEDDEPNDSAAQEEPQPATVPLLRVAEEAAEPAEAEPSPVAPLEQLRRIESALSEIDGSDFQPAGSIGPEVELVFPDPGNPFNEPFEEEEVVVQRYTGQARHASAATDTVSHVVVSPAASLDEAATTSTAVLSERRTLPLYPETAEQPVGDLDLVTVEDDYDDVPPPLPARPVTPVHHMEYRRLFAKLRHG
jgi:type II secretory pathway predicted ATPase ExeA